LIALASAFTQFLQIFIDQGMTEAIIQEPALDERHLNAAFFTNLIWSLFLWAITWAGSNYIAELYKEPLLSSVLRWLSLGFIISAFSSTQISYLRKQLQFRILAIRSVISKSVAAIVAIVLAYLGFGVWSLVAQLLVMNVLGVIILWSSSDWKPTFRFSRSHFKSLLKFGIQITASRILGVINAQLHDFAIGYFMDATLLGLFSVAHTLTKRLVDIIRNVILEVAYPAFTNLQNKPLHLRSMFCEVSRITAVIIFPIFTLIFISAPEL
jgi:PST family polysaccharide transporter